MDAFDADVLIYAAQPGNPLGRRVRALFPSGPVDAVGRSAGIGSLLLYPELLSKPTREHRTRDTAELLLLLERLDLLPVDRLTAERAMLLGAHYRLRAADAVHLATAVLAGADRFITNNRRDFTKSITEVDVTYPDDLPEP